jgi:asparagine synthase (glutamine-hydrolysing)
MFQYVALAWNNTVEQQAAAAQVVSKALQASAKWQAHLLYPGLHVFTAGARKNVNGSYLLAAHGGVVLGRLFRRRELAVHSIDLELTEQEIDRIARTSGQALIDDFWGRYVAFLPAPSQSSFVLRDPSGALPCYRLQHHGITIACSWLEGLLEALPDLSAPRVSWDALAAHVVLGRLGGGVTALEGVAHVPSGRLTRLADGSSEELWSAVDIARAPIDEPAELAADRMRQTVRYCARSWAACHDDILLRLSGGLDSAILLSCLRPDATPARITCLNYHSPGSDSDERPYARAVADHMGMPLIEKECDPAYPLDEVLNVALTPTPESYVGRMSMAQMDAQTATLLGSNAMFTGGGGDQLFFEHRCTWPAADYLRIRGIDRGFPGAIQDAARLGRVSFWTAAGRAFTASRRGPHGNESAFTPGLACDELRLDRPEQHVHPGLALAGDLPAGKFLQVQQLLNPIGYYDPYLRDRAPELVNPLLSQPLIELCLALPTYLLTHGGRGRALARQAFASDLPRQITHRRSKGGMEEHLTAVLRRNLPFVRDLLFEGQLAGRHLLDRTRLETVLSDRPSTLAAHVSEIHGYVAIEAWLHRAAAMQHARSE